MLFQLQCYGVHLTKQIAKNLTNLLRYYTNVRFKAFGALLAIDRQLVVGLDRFCALSKLLNLFPCCLNLLC